MKMAVGAENPIADTAADAPPKPVGTDAARLAILVGTYFDFAWRSLRRLGVAEPDVDDAAQQLFMVVGRRLNSIEAERERSFVFGSAVRIAAAYRRTRRRQSATYPGDGDTVAVDPLPSPEDLLDLKRARVLLDFILDRLPIDLRATLILAEGEGMTRREIAELFEIAEGTAGSRLRRARAAFDAELDDYRSRQGREAR
jgi:RNA polymerase sigma-70 factor, ECF subfamily